jgi:type IV pilus assembly protein PilA
LFQTAKGFTLIELLIVISIVGILTGILLPSLLGARAKANDTAARGVAREVLNAMGAIEASADGALFESCTWANGFVSFQERTGAGVIQNTSFRVNAASPIKNVYCASADNGAIGGSPTTPATPQGFFGVLVEYIGGSVSQVTVTAAK